MHFRTLKTADITALSKAFNLAFDNYFVPMQMTTEQFHDHFLRKEKVDLDASGAFFDESGEILAFIMHSIKVHKGSRVAYNAGTGVVPGARGQKLTIRLYTALLEKLKVHALKHVFLEVITQNHGAIKIYEKLGFRKTRTLDVFSFTGDKNRSKHDFEIEEIEWQNEMEFAHFSDFIPSLPCQPQNFAEIKDKLTCLGWRQNEQLKGYAFFNSQTGRLHFLGIHKNSRRQGAGTALLREVINRSEEKITLINIPSDAEGIQAFLSKNRMEIKLSQYEMKYQFQALSQVV